MPEAVARSPIAPAPPVAVEAGWQVSGRRSAAALRISDRSPAAKVLVRAPEGGAASRALVVGFGRAARDERLGALVVGSGPGEWYLLAPPGTAGDVAARVEAGGDDGPVSVVDLTHGRALLRLTGDDAAGLLSKVCAIDLADEVTPDGAAFRSSVAGVVTDVVRDDTEGRRSYLLHCERSTGQFLFDALVDAGEEFGVDVDGFQQGPRPTP